MTALPPPSQMARWHRPSLGEAVAIYGYRSAEGELLYEKGRWERTDPTAGERSKDFAFREPDPDRPGRFKKGKGGARVLYRLPELRAAREDQSGEAPVLFITEGEKDADRLAALGLVSTTNDGGASGPFPDDWLEELQGFRQVVVCEDNDLPGRRRAARLAFEARKVVNDVRVLSFPEFDEHADVSDYLDAGKKRDELWQRVEACEQVSARVVRSSPGLFGRTYENTPKGIVLVNGQTRQQLTNFGARITAQVVRDDGVEQKRYLELEATMGSRVRPFGMPSERFADIRRWALDELGCEAIVYPVNKASEHATVAIQQDARGVPERHAYAHTGWTTTDQGPVFLHAGGAIGCAGVVATIDVALHDDMARFELPAPPSGEHLCVSVRASLGLLDVAPDRVMVPVLGAVYRAPFGAVDLSVFLTGSTGNLKSAIAALCQQHYGASFDALHLPANWGFTGYAIAAMAFLAKDVLLVVDDFKPEGSQAEINAMHRTAALIFRSQGNLAGRGRADRSGEMRPTKPPRGLILATGEDVPRVESVRARIIVVEVEADDVVLAELTRAQQAATSGAYAAATAAFVQWIAGQGLEAAASERKTEAAELRAELNPPGVHRRTAPALAEIGAGWSAFLHFAVGCEACTVEEAATLRKRVVVALRELAQRQGVHQAEENPARRFLRGLGAALRSGRAHLSDLRGNIPVDAEAWGWRRDFGSYAPQGPKVGWVDGEHVYIDRAPAIAAVNDLVQKVSSPIGLGERQLGKELDKLGALARSDDNRGTTTSRITTSNGRPEVWVVRRSTIVGTTTREKATLYAISLTKLTKLTKLTRRLRARGLVSYSSRSITDQFGHFP